MSTSQPRDEMHTTSHVTGKATKPRRSRARGLRTTTGCIVCRKRHLKCDEVKPVCGACVRSQRICEYPEPVDDDGGGGFARKKEAASSIPGWRDRPHNLTVDDNPELGDQSQAPQQMRTPSIPVTSPDETGRQFASPASSHSASTGYGTEIAPLRWLGLLAGDAARNPSFAQPTPSQSENGHLPSHSSTQFDLTALENGNAFKNPFHPLRISAIAPPGWQLAGVGDERQCWQAAEPLQLTEYERNLFQHFVTTLSRWIDLFDPLQHFSFFVPHLALRNEGLMKAILALGARHLSIKPVGNDVAGTDRTAAVEYYYQTLQYLQSAMQFTSYKSSQELLATVLVVSTYEMIDGAGQGWERHLKGVFWIQRSREINGESGGLEQAIWWAWLRQDVWAAFRERRRCFSFFKPTNPCRGKDMWETAAKSVYLLAQSVNYASDEETERGRTDFTGRIDRANTVLDMLDTWRSHASVHFNPLPIKKASSQAFEPVWVHPPALATSVQLYCMAKTLLCIHKPAAGGYLENMGRDKVIKDCIDTIGGIALELNDDVSRLMSTQCLFAAGLYCADAGKRSCIVELITDHTTHTGWPANTNLAEELQLQWSQQILR